MLGEIVKSTEALRYHAKSAEIAGKNLAHVNDENYARQRVLAREGLMYNGQGGLRTSSIESGGLDHARNDLIDKRLFKEFGETAALESQEEILKLLQAALGEKIDRQAVDGGLDDEHQSNLSAGGLARAMDDLFNAFQELSASPDTSVASQEIFNKINILTNRFNDAGVALDEIESDLTESVDYAVSKVNSILGQIQEVNTQIRRFELLGQGKAVSYRDRRQSLLEDLSKLIDFSISPEVNSSGAETGFVNIYAKSSFNQDVVLLDAKTGVHQLNKNFGNMLTPSSSGTLGSGLQVKPKVDDEGKLGFIEVVDGGSQYDDSAGPLILTFSPPLRGGFDVSIEAHERFSFFEQDGRYFQALAKVPAGISLSDPTYFLELPEEVTTQAFSKGSFFKSGGVFYEALLDMPAGSALSDQLSFARSEEVNLVDRAKGSFFQEGEKFYQVFADLPVGVPLSDAGSFVNTDPINLKDRAEGSFFKQDTKYYRALQDAKAGTLLSDASSFVQVDPVSIVNREEGSLFFENDTYYQTLVNSEAGTLLSDTEAFLEIEPTLLSDYAEGTIFSQGGTYYRALVGIEAGTLLSDTDSLVEIEPVSLADYEEGAVFKQDEQYYRSLVDSESGALLSNDSLFELLNVGVVQQDYEKGDLFEQDGVYYEVFSALPKGTLLSSVADFVEIDPVNLSSYKKEDIFEQGGKYYKALEDVTTGTALSNTSVFLELPEPVSLEDYSAGSIFKQNGTYYEALKDVPKWTSLSETSAFAEKSEPFSLVPHETGSFFSQNGKFYQALDNVPKGTPLSLKESFLEIDPKLLPSNGGLSAYPETLRRYSDLETFQAGEQVYFDGKLFQSSRDILPVSVLGDGANSELESRDYYEGEVIKIRDSFYQFIENVSKSDADLDAIQGKSLIEIGPNLPTEVDEFSYFTTVLSDVGQRDFSSRSYDIGDFVKINDPDSGKFRYFEFSNQLIRDDELNIRIDAEDQDKWIITDPDGNVLARESVSDPSLGFGKISNIPGDSTEFLVEGVFEKDGVEINAVTAQAQSIEDLKVKESPMRFRQNEVYFFTDSQGKYKHFVVTDPPSDINPLNFDPQDSQWSSNFKFFSPQLLDEGQPDLFIKRAQAKGYEQNLVDGSLVQLNVGVAEAVVNDGQITGFNILSSGNNLPKSDSVFVDGVELSVESGSIKGLQDAKSDYVSKFRNDLNELVTSFVDEINGIYNKDDYPGNYLFGFDAILTRPVVGRNTLMEDEYGYFGREGDGNITLYREEVSMQLPTADSETFNIVNVTPVFPEDFVGQQYYVRGEDAAEIDFAPESTAASFSFYGSARRMQNVTMENDPSYSGADKIVGTEDDGRSYMMAYEPVPFRLDGLEDGSRLPIIGDNFSFSALPSNPWNLATSLKVQKGLSVESIIAHKENNENSNQIALKIAEMGNDKYLSDIALLNSDIGNSLSSLSDNLEHQQSIENVLLDQRRAVSSVSIDEEVADLMRFQRSFQASSRVLNTLDKMLEIVVMGLLR